MKKVLLGVFFAMASLSYAQQSETTQNLGSHQKEDIDFSIKESPLENAQQKTYEEPPSAHQITTPKANSAPVLAPEVSAKHWKSLQEEKEKEDKKQEDKEKADPKIENNEIQNNEENSSIDEKTTQDTANTTQTTQENNPAINENEKQDEAQKDSSPIPTQTKDEANNTKNNAKKASQVSKPPKIERKIEKQPPEKKEGAKDTSAEDSSANSKKITFSQEEFYSPKKNEISISKNGQKLFVDIHSKELQKFMEGIVYNTKQQVQTFALKDSYTQITNVDGKIQEYKYAQKSIDRYSAIAPHQKYSLKKISPNKYQILIKKIPPFFDIRGCKVVVKKELTGTLNQTKEIIINLDTKRELRNNPHFDLFLECPQ